MSRDTVTQPTVARRVERVLGVWAVVHPFTGSSEFTTSHLDLAQAVGEEFDRRDPITISWLYEQLAKLPIRARKSSEWVCSYRTSMTIRQLSEPSGLPLWWPPLVMDGPVILLGRPVVIDESAVGIALREEA